MESAEAETDADLQSEIDLIDAKKEGLKKSYDDLLASFPSLLTSLNLTWPNLDTHFASLQASLARRLHLLHSLRHPESRRIASDADPVPDSSPTGCSIRKDENFSSGFIAPIAVATNEAGAEAGLARPQTPEAANVEAMADIKALCSKVDAGGLLMNLIDHENAREAIRDELIAQIRSSPDPGKLILDAMGWFYLTKKAKEGDTSLLKTKSLRSIRNGCIFLLEAVMSASPPINDRDKVRAEKMAMMGMQRTPKDPSAKVLISGFLLLVACFGLVSKFNFKDLAEYFLYVASCQHATELCRGLGLGDGIPDLIEKLKSGEDEILAVKFIFNLGMSKKFPPVPILKTHLDRLKELTKRSCEGGKDSLQVQRETMEKEIKGLASVIKIINSHKLKSEYSDSEEELRKRIQQLEKLKFEKNPVGTAQKPQNPQASNNKRPRANPAAKAQEHHNLQTISNKRPRANPVNIPRNTNELAPHLHPGSAHYGIMGPPLVGSPSAYHAAPLGPVGFPGHASLHPSVHPPELQYPHNLPNPPLYGNMWFSPPEYGGHSTHPPEYGGYGGYSMHPEYHLPYYPQ